MRIAGPAATAPLLLIRLRRLLLGMAFCLAAACGQERSESPSRSGTVGTHSPEIAWFDGTVEEAFATASAQGKPLFLYWGAEWCPPCHYLKKRVFSQPGFVARMQEFVPVYLDGDTERAQNLGEELAVMGYPTVIIFSPQGEEVMRMPSTVPTDRYEEILEAATNDMRPLKSVLDEVLAVGPARAPIHDLRILAFHSWGQDSQIDLSDSERLETFRRLHQETPRDRQVERSSFLGLLLQSLALAANSPEDTQSIAGVDRLALQSEVLQVLDDPPLRNANVLWIYYYADSIIDFLQPDPAPERDALIAAWLVAAEQMEIDDGLTVDDRLKATILRLELASLAAGTDSASESVSSQMQAHVRRQMAWALETVTDESELQTVVNTLANLLETVGLTQEAEAMLLARMNDTIAPYYFMSWIAILKEDAGEDEVALEWYRKAYDASRGRYSRFRWGSNYLRRLMSLAPARIERIEADSVEVLTELLSHGDAFAGGNQDRLKSLEQSYWDWNEDGAHDAVLVRIRDLVHASCPDYPGNGDDSARARCESFLVPRDLETETAL